MVRTPPHACPAARTALVKSIMVALPIFPAAAFRAVWRLLSSAMVIFTLARGFSSAAKTLDAPETGVGVGVGVGVELALVSAQPANMLTAMMPARAREAIFLSFIVNFSSLWCIKDRDPKQAERKVLSFQRHYSIPPPVSRPDLLFFGFCFLFVTLGGSVKCIFSDFMQSFCILILFISVSPLFCPLSHAALRHDSSPARGGAKKEPAGPLACPLTPFIGEIAGAPEGRAYQSERRADGARKKRCAIPLTRSKELFQPDARSDLLLLGPGLRPGRCGRVGSPEGVGRGSRNPRPPPLAQRSDKTAERKKSARFRALCTFAYFL